ncbi:MAG TPA: protein kinase [Aggregatilineales bacterium]|nr:protein kinase [Anaerolineales bacterium]HRE48108.1 protein kinase [Aggregatilineales bacterium]
MTDNTGLFGKMVRGYELRRLLGAGGFGEVYLAHQAVVGRDVAVKVILPEFANQDQFITNFEAEAHLVARLEHPHIIPLYDYWRDPSGAYIIMRYVPGGNLRLRLIQKIRLSPEELTDYLDQIAGALMAAHRAGVVHRDIKPDNILLDMEDNTYLADFGIAKLLHTANASSGDSPSPARVEEGEMIVGSPAYLAPEQIMGIPVSPQTDLYALGIVLYELLTGKRPFMGDLSSTQLIFSHLNQPLPSLRSELPHLPMVGALDSVLQQATAKSPTDRFPDARAMARAFREAVQPAKPSLVSDSSLLLIDPLEHDVLFHEDDVMDHTTGERVISILLPNAENPYKGLRAFSEVDAADFFGREALIMRLLGRLVEKHALVRFLAVVGPSGSGKSSVVKAGVIPALRRNGLPGSGRWFYAEMMPGTQPLHELAAALLTVASIPQEIETLVSQFMADERGLLNALRDLSPGGNQVVLVIDQFEEAFTQARRDSEAGRFLDNIAAAINEPNSRFWVVVTLRADFYDRPLLHPTFGTLMRERTEVVLPLSAEELGQAVTGPARRVGLTLEPGLVETIVSDVGDQAGALPLLQYALTELFERRRKNTLILDSYREMGGVLGALARRADELYLSLPPEQQIAVETIFLRLVTLGEGTEDTRRRARQTEFSAAVNASLIQAVMDTFAKYRLLTFDRDPETRIPTVEVAHEALIRTWSRLREWLDTNREAIRTGRRLSAATVEWVNAGRDSSFLAEGARLGQYEALLSDSTAALSADESAYIRASAETVKRREREEKERVARELDLAKQAAQSAQAAAAAQQRNARRLRAFLLFFALGTVVMAGLGVLALRARNDSVVNEARAIENAVTATVAQGDALNSAATARANADLAANNAATATVAQGNALNSAATARANADLAANNAATATVAQGAALNNEGTAVAALKDAEISLAHANALRLASAASSIAASGRRPHLVGVLAIQALNSSPVQPALDEADNALTLPLPLPQRRLDVHNAMIADLGSDLAGRYIVSGDENGMIFLHDARTYAQIKTWSNQGIGVTALSLSPDGKYLATGGADYAIRLWSIPNGTLVYKTFFNRDLISALVWLSDSQTYFATSSDSSVTQWSVAENTPRQIQTMEWQPEGITLTPDERMLVVSGYGGVITLVDRASFEVLHEIATGSIRVGIARVVTRQMVDEAGNPINRDFLIAALDEGLIKFFELVVVGGSVDSLLMSNTLDGHVGSIYDMAISPDAHYALTAGEDGTVRLWDISDPTVSLPIRVYRAHAASVYSVQFIDRGQAFLSAGEDTVIYTWRLQEPNSSLLLGHQAAVLDVAYSVGNNLALTTAAEKDVIRAILWDVETSSARGALQTYSYPDLSADGNAVAVTSSGKGNLPHLQVYDTTTLEVIHDFSLADGAGGDIFPFEVYFVGDGKYVLLIFDDGISLWEIATGTERLVLPLEGFIGGDALAISADGSLLAVAVFNTLSVYHLPDGDILDTSLFEHEQNITSLAFSADGETLFYALTDGTLYLTTPRQLGRARRIEVRQGGITQIAASPDGAYLYALSDRTRVIQVDLKNNVGTIIRRFDVAGGLEMFALAADGSRLIMGGRERLTRFAYTDGTRTTGAICERLIALGYQDLLPKEREEFNLQTAPPTCTGFRPMGSPPPGGGSPPPGGGSPPPGGGNPPPGGGNPPPGGGSPPPGGGNPPPGVPPAITRTPGG